MINGLDYSSRVRETPESLYKRLEENYSNMDKDELAVFIRNNYKVILASVFDEYGNPTNIGKFVFTTRFLTVLANILMFEEGLSTTERTQGTRIACFAVYKLPEHSDNEYFDLDDPLIVAAFLLTKACNKELVARLAAIKDISSERVASFFVIGKYIIENDEAKSVQMVCSQILGNIPLNSEQPAVDIFLTLFNRALPIFTGIILLTNKEIMNKIFSMPDRGKMARKNMDLITSAALTIMNELPIVDIKRGLTIFNDDRKMLYPGKALYTPLDSISEIKYPRIVRALQELSNEGVYIQYK